MNHGYERYAYVAAYLYKIQSYDWPISREKARKKYREV